MNIVGKNDTMMNEISLFIEGYEYTVSGYNRIIDVIGDNDDIIKRIGDKFTFLITGFIIVDNCPIIVFPKNYILPKTYSDLKKEAMVLLQVLLKYRMEKHHEPEEIKLLFGENESSTGRIISSIALIEDYQNRGLLHRKMKVKAANKSGFIEWTSTVNKTTPYVSYGQPIYFNPIMRSSVVDESNLLTMIHKYIIHESIKHWGWLFGIDDILYDEILLPYEETTILNYLKQELAQTYIHREIFVIKNLIQYIEGKNGTVDNINYEILATPYFNLTWESICGFIYSNEYNRLSKWVAQPVWNSNVITKSISQRPDILFVKESVFYILDAKYYDYNKTIPGWHDVVKQLFYKYTISTKIAKTGKKFVDSFENVLIFPENSDKKFTYLGRVYVDEADDLGEVKAFAINTKAAMEAYAEGIQSDFKEHLLCEIQKENSDTHKTAMRLIAYEKAMRGGV